MVHIRRHLWWRLFFVGVIVVYAISWVNLVGGWSNLGHQTDFLPSYTAVRMVLAGDGQQLYNLATQSVYQHQLVSNLTVYPDNLLPFIHPPFYVLLLLPLGFFSLEWAFVIITLVNVAAPAALLGLVYRYLPGAKNIDVVTIGVVAVAFWPYFVNLVQGQNAAVTLLIFTAAFLLLQKEHDAAAGAVLVLGLFKPQLNILVAVILLLKGRWKAVAAYSGGALFWGGISLLMIGSSGVMDYLHLTLLDSPLVDGSYGVHYIRMHNWIGFFTVLLKGTVWENRVRWWAGIASVISVIGLGYGWRGKWQPHHRRFLLQFALTVLVMLLISPHLNIHDLTMWILVAILSLVYAAEVPLSPKQQKVLGLLMAAISVLSFFTVPLAQLLHLQIPTLVMVFAIGLIVWALKKDPATTE